MVMPVNRCHQVIGIFTVHRCGILPDQQYSNSIFAMTNTNNFPTKMETPHPVSEKKRFKTYLLEGLMIFVAVMMGFFAESLRENISNKEKEREYISSLLHNLEQDTTFLKGVIRDNQKKIAGLDSLISI